MAFSLNTAELNALLAKGLISNDLYDQLAPKKPSEQAPALKETAKKAQIEFPQEDMDAALRGYKPAPTDERLAENTTAKTTTSDATDTGRAAPAPVSNAHETPVKDSGFTAMPQMTAQQAQEFINGQAQAQKEKEAAVNTPRPNVQLGANPSPADIMAAANNRPGAAPTQPGITGNVITKPTPQQIAGFRAIEEDAKRGIPADQVAGNRPVPKPVAPPPQAPAIAPKPVGGGPVAPAYKGPGSTTYGPPTANVGKYLSPSEVERMGELNTRTLAAQGLEQRAGDVMVREQEAVARAHEDAAAKNEAMFQEQQAYQKSFNDHQQELWNKLYSDTEKNGNAKIDPDRAWKQGVFGENATGNKILGGIAILLGGIGQGASVTGGARGASNQGMDAITGAINKDLENQKWEIANNANSLQARWGLLNDRWNQFKDMDLAKAAARKDYLDIVEYKIKSIASSNASEKTKIALDKSLVDLDNQKQDALYQFKQLADLRARGQASAAAAMQSQMNNRLYEQFKSDQESLRKVNEKLIESGQQPISMTQYKGASELNRNPSNPEFAKNEQTRQGQDRESAQHLGDKIAPLASSLQAIERAEKDYQKGGALEGLSSPGSTALSYGRTQATGKVLIPENMLNAEQNFDQVTNKYIHDTTGAALNKEGEWEGQNAGEARRLLGTIKGDGSAAARQHGLSMMRQDIDAQRKALLTGATPGAAARFAPPPSQAEKDKTLGAEKNK